MGDLVSGVLWFSGLVLTQKIIGATISFDNEANETVELELQVI